MPNTFAYLVFFSAPLVIWLLFRRQPLPAAIALTIIGSYLFLPSRINFDLPILPALNKHLLPGLVAIFLAGKLVKTFSANGGRLPVTVLEGWVPRNTVTRLLLVMFLGGAFMTVILNGDPLIYGTRRLPGLRIYDTFSTILSMLVVLIPFFLARKYLADSKAHALLLWALVALALIYSLPTLYEVRMSPQVNKMIYGYFPTAWIQHLRGDGYRPVVFLDHGLELGIFLTVAIVAGIGTWRLETPGRKVWLIGAICWLLITLVLSKTFGALMIAVCLIPIVLFLGPKMQIKVAALLAICILAFPMLRGAGWVPVERVVGIAQTFDEQRAASLRFRLENEEILLDKANQRPMFGFGGWGRSRVFNEEGQDIGTTDGYWLISLGLGGWMRYLSEFGLLVMPVLLLAFGRAGREVTLATSTLCVAIVANLIDLIPNAGLTAVTWLIAGALTGRLEDAAVSPQEDGDDPIPEASKKLPYSRNHGKLHPARNVIARQ